MFHRHQHLWIALLCVVVSFALYGNSIPGEFVFDDAIFSEDEAFRSIAHIPTIWISPGAPGVPVSGYRPLSYTSYALNYLLIGPSPAGFHIVNILLHALMLFLIYRLIMRLCNRKDLALVTLVLFAVLPIHTENVANIKGRDDMISAVFGMMGWLLFLRATASLRHPQQKSTTHYPQRTTHNARLLPLIGSAVCFFLAITGKELIILIPALYLGVWWINSRPPLKNVFTHALPYGVVGIIYAAMRVSIFGNNAFNKDLADFVFNPLVREPLPVKIWTIFKIFTLYIQKTFIPYNLSMTHNYNHLTVVRNPLDSPETLIGILLLSALIFLVIKGKTVDIMLRAGALIFLVSYITISKVFISAADILAERWMYVPSLGLVIVAAVPLTWLFRKKLFLGWMVFAPLLLIYSATTISRNLVWRDEETAMKSSLQSAPNSVQSHYVAAAIYLRKGDLEKAWQEGQIAYAIYPRYTRLLVTLGKIAAAQKHNDIAMEYFFKAVETAPQDEEAHQYYALSLAKLGRYQESIDHVLPEIRRRPRDLKLRYIMAVDYYKLGNIIEAKKYFDWTDKLTDEQKIRRLEEF